MIDQLVSQATGTAAQLEPGSGKQKRSVSKNTEVFQHTRVGFVFIPCSVILPFQSLKLLGALRGRTAQGKRLIDVSRIE